MEKAQLRETLERLHAELNRTESVDETSRLLLRKLQLDIEELLESRSGPSVRKRLQDGVHHFEASHPALARTIADVLDSLALVGL